MPRPKAEFDELVRAIRAAFAAGALDVANTICADNKLGRICRRCGQYPNRGGRLSYYGACASCQRELERR